MSVQVKRRREAAAFLQNFVGAQGELLVDTTNNRVQVHDGTTPGGFPASRFKVPTQTILTTASGAAGTGTYAPPAGASWLRVRMVAGGGGGAGSGPSPGNGTAGGVTSFGALSCNGGNGATGMTRGTSSGVPTGGDINFGGNGGLDGVFGVTGLTFPGRRRRSFVLCRGRRGRCQSGRKDAAGEQRVGRWRWRRLGRDRGRRRWRVRSLSRKDPRGRKLRLRGWRERQWGYSRYWRLCRGPLAAAA